MFIACTAATDRRFLQSSAAQSRLAGANSASHIALGSTGTLIGSIVAGIVLTV